MLLPRSRRSPARDQRVPRGLACSNLLECLPRLLEMEAVVAGGEPEHQLVALGAALVMDPDAGTVLQRRALPQVEVRGPKRSVDREEVRGISVAVAQPLGPQVLVV